MKNKKVIILLSTVIGILLITIGLGIFSLNSSWNDKKKISETEKQKLSEEEKTDNYQKISEKITFLEFYLSDIYPIEDANKLSEKEKTLFLLKSSCNYSNKTITEEQLIEKAHEYFKDFNLYQGDLKDKKGKVLYSYEKGKYSIKTVDDSKITTMGYELSNNGTKDKWIVKRKLYYTDFTLDDINFTYTTNFYAKKDDKKPIFTRTSETNSMSLKKEEYQKIESKLETATYEFIKENNNYLLKSVILN